MSSNQFNERISKLRTEDPKVSITLNPQQSAVHILSGRLSAPTKASELKKSPFIHARRFIAENKALFGDLDEKTELSDGRILKDDIGGTHLVFYQKYGDARVMGGAISVHYGEDGAIYLTKSDLVDAIDLPTKPKIGPAKATKIAIKDAGSGAEAFMDKKPELFVVNADTANIEGKGPKNYLCWKIGIVYPKGETNPDWIYFVDALTEKVLFCISAMQTGQGRGFYSTGTDLFTKRLADGICYLQDVKTSYEWPIYTDHPERERPIILTYDDAGSGHRALEDLSSDPDDIWNRENPANPDDDQRQEVDIHRFVGYVMKYLYEKHSWRGLWAGDMYIKAHAHSGCLFNDAAWNCLYEQMYFNSGDWVSRTFISTLDIVGHEYIHGLLWGFGIVQYYQWETGAVNEAICDIFGSLIAEAYHNDCPSAWKIGNQSYLTGRGRDTTNPTRNGGYDATSEDTVSRSVANGCYPDHYSMLYAGPRDYQGVHINSTVLSHAVNLMIYGGTNHTSNMRVTGLNIRMPVERAILLVERMMWQVISTGLLTEISKFKDFRDACILACQYLCRYRVYEADTVGLEETVRQALDAVGVHERL